MYIKIGLDLGNNTTCAVSELNNDYVYKYISSTYSEVSEFSKDNIVNINGEEIQLGNKSGSELTNFDKTRRLYLEHQILWAVNSIFGHMDYNNFELELAVGLPISDFSDLEKRTSYQTTLNNIKKIVGTVDGKKISVDVKRVIILAEGYSSIKALLDTIPNNGYSTVICDIGFLTTDVIVLDIEDGKMIVRKPVTLNKGISFLYERIYKDVSKLECLESKTELDYYIRKNQQTLRTKDNDEYMLEEELLKRTNECSSIINDISNKLGFKTTTCNKIFIGGGSVLLFKILGTNWVKNHIEVDDNTRYSANAKGYYLSL